MAHAVHSSAPVNKWIIASTVVLASFVVVMDVSIVNVAMPQMLGEFGVTLDAITWVAVAYSIAEIILVDESGSSVNKHRYRGLGVLCPEAVQRVWFVMV